MTKVRPPASFPDAITRIAALIGWSGCVAVLSTDNRKVSERAIRNWSDPDTGASVPIEDALRLDLAFIAAGGQGTPLYDAFTLQLDREIEAARMNNPCMVSTTAEVAKETGEAIHALVLASSPTALPRDKARAEAEIVEAIEALQKSRAALLVSSPERSAQP